MDSGHVALLQHPSDDFTVLSAHPGEKGVDGALVGHLRGCGALVPDARPNPFRSNLALTFLGLTDEAVDHRSVLCAWHHHSLPGLTVVRSDASRANISPAWLERGPLADAPCGTIWRVARYQASSTPQEEWVHVDWAVREDGNNDAAVRELKGKYPEVNADPENWRFDIICGRDGVANVRLMRRSSPAPPRPPRKRPRRS